MPLFVLLKLAISLAPRPFRGMQFQIEVPAQGIGVPHAASVLVHNPTQDGLVNPGLAMDLVSALLNKHADEPSAHPADWMPWTYRDTLAKQAAPPLI